MCCYRSCLARAALSLSSSVFAVLRPASHVPPPPQVSLFTVLHPSPESELKSGVGAVGGGARTAPVAVKARCRRRGQGADRSLGPHSAALQRKQTPHPPTQLNEALVFSLSLCHRAA